MDIDALLRLSSIVAALFTAVGALLGLLPILTRAGKAIVQERKERDHFDTRMAELDAALTREETLQRRAGISDTTLTIGQYIIGGVLASSFVQNAMAPLVGFLGVLVLISSLVRQQFKPEQQFRDASQRVARLKSLRREVQDELAAAVKSRTELARLVSRGLNEVELSAISAIDRNNKSGPPAAGGT